MVSAYARSAMRVTSVFKSSCCRVFCLALALAFGAMPMVARADVLIGTNGERFVGTVIEETTNTVVFESELGGRLILPRRRFANSSEHRRLNQQPDDPSGRTHQYSRHATSTNAFPGSRPASATTAPTGSSSSRANGCGASSNTSRTRRSSLTATNWMNRR